MKFTPLPSQGEWGGEKRGKKKKWRSRKKVVLSESDPCEQAGSSFDFTTNYVVSIVRAEFQPCLEL